MEIRWRPSRGRGEYEYRTAQAGFQGKKIVLEVPGLGVRIPTDVRFDFKNGKRRLRRDNPNDKSLLNFPPLAAAIAGLPAPQRSYDTELAYPLKPGSYVVDSVLSDVVEQTATTVVLAPRALKPRGSSGLIDIEERIENLRKTASKIPQVKALLVRIATGSNSTTLAELANGAHAAYPFSPATGGASAVSAPAPSGPAPGAAPSPSGATPTLPGIPPATNPPFPPDEDLDDIIDNYSGKEGKERIRTHRYKERNKVVVDKAKSLFKKKFSKLFCECCGISFEEHYKPIGADFIEAHHRVPLESLNGETETKPQDLAMLCPNCHRMVHKTKSLSIDEVREVLKKNGVITNHKNLELLTPSSK